MSCFLRLSPTSRRRLQPFVCESVHNVCLGSNLPRPAILHLGIIGGPARPPSLWFGPTEPCYSQSGVGNSRVSPARAGGACAIPPCSPPVRSSDGPVMVAVRLYRGVSPARAGGACAIPPCSPPVRSSDGPILVAVRLYRFACEGPRSD